MKKKSKTYCFRALFSGLILLVASGCIPGNSIASSVPSEGELFKPPTQPAPLQENTPSEGNILPLQLTPPCQNGLAFLADISIPDGTMVAPGALVDKSWEVENIGSCSWNAEYSIRHVGGSNLGAETTLPLYPARSGTRAVISIQFTAPAESGTIHSAWRAYAPDGQPFGDAVYLQINVSDSQP
ncbi:MAG: NBR1-Ig-like domain-containing protein [Anaerolineaceae bacterium]